MSKLQIVSRLKNFLESEKSSLKYKSKASDFTRVRKLTFERVVCFLLNLPKKSLSVELLEFWDILGLEYVKVCTKSAFCQARQKLKHEFFIDWSTELIKSFYELGIEKRWKGFLLLSVDGSKGSLFEDEDLSEEFGRENGKVGAKLVNVYDVLNRLSVYSRIEGIRTSENKVARFFIGDLKERRYIHLPLMIYDRNFAGFEFMYLHHQEGVNYVARCKTKNYSRLVNDFLASKKKMQ